MPVTIAKEKWTSKLQEMVIGVEPNAVKVGGEGTLPFLTFEGEMPNRQVVALEVWDMEPSDWPEVLTRAFTSSLGDPVAWAKECEEKGADLVCLRLASAHPDNKDASPADCAAVARAVADAIKVPMIVIGCGVEDKDAELITAVAEALAGKNVLLGCATPNNYKTITAAAMVHGHNVIASSPLDINLAKQLNILITEMAMAPNRIAIDPLVGALGYGIEYAYSIIERCRLGALMGDKMLSQPVICFVGQETWKTKEAKSTTEEIPAWGEQFKRAIMWEVMTATAFAHAGAHIFVLRHPESVKQVKVHLENMFRPLAY